MIHAMELPWGRIDELKEKHGLKMVKGGIALYSGALLPADLRPYASEDFSYTRWLEDERNATVMPYRPLPPLPSLTPPQEEAREALLTSFREGSPGFYLGEPRWTGADLIILDALARAAQERGLGVKTRGKLLIVTAKGFEERWRMLVAASPALTKLLRPLIVNYTQLNKLLTAPPQARITHKASVKARQTSKHGVPTIDWSFIVFDEAQALQGYPRNKVALEAAALAKLNSSYQVGTSPFVVFATPTPGASPLDLALMAPLITHACGWRNSTPTTWADTLKSRGYSITEGRYGPTWLPLPKRPSAAEEIAHTRQKTKESVLIAKVLRGASSCSVMTLKDHSSLLPVPLQATSSQKGYHQEAWETLRQALRKTSDAEAIDQALAAYRTRLASLKSDSVLEEILSFRDGSQPILVQAATGKLAERMGEKLVSKKVSTLLGVGLDGAALRRTLEVFVEGDAQVLIMAGASPQLRGQPLVIPRGWSPWVYLLDLQGGIAPSLLGWQHRWMGPRSLTHLTYLRGTPEENLIEAYREAGALKAEEARKILRLEAVKARR